MKSVQLLRAIALVLAANSAAVLITGCGAAQESASQSQAQSLTPEEMGFVVEAAMAAVLFDAVESSTTSLNLAGVGTPSVNAKKPCAQDKACFAKELKAKQEAMKASAKKATTAIIQAVKPGYVSALGAECDRQGTFTQTEMQGCQAKAAALGREYLAKAAAARPELMTQAPTSIKLVMDSSKEEKAVVAAKAKSLADKGITVSTVVAEAASVPEVAAMAAALPAEAGLAKAAEPKAEPKAEPTVEPAPVVTEAPKAEPKAEPTVEPAPVATEAPKAEPTVEPELLPTVAVSKDGKYQGVQGQGSQGTLVAGWTGNGANCSAGANGVNCSGQVGDLAGAIARAVPAAPAENARVAAVAAPSAAAPAAAAAPVVSSIAVGDMHGCAIVAGQVVCSSQRNDNNENGTASGVITTAAPAVKVSAGSAHTCALDAAGDVTCWGWNGTGQLGLPPSASEAPVKVASGATDVRATRAGTCWTDSSGKETCIGSQD